MTAHPCTYHHLHLAASDSVAAADWYLQHLGGRRHSAGGYELLFNQSSFLIWYRRDSPPSVGGVLDHFGWSLAELEPTIESMVATGAKLLDGPREVGPQDLRICFLEDPWGAKIELLVDPEHLGFHHVHLLVEDVEAHRDAMVEAFGGSKEMFKGLVTGIRYDSMWCLYRPTAERLAPTKGRAIDHFAFGVLDLSGEIDRLAAQGLELDEEPRTVGDLEIAFMVAPAGVRVELVQPV